MPKVWVADDDQAIRMVLEESLSSDGFDVTLFESGEELITELKKGEPDLILTDVQMPGMHGYDLLKHINNNYEDIPVIIMTAFTDMQAAVDSYGGGAFEYLPKPFDLDEAAQIINRALEVKPKTKGLKKSNKAEIIGEAASMQIVFRAIGKLSNTNATVLVQGESGTGKELIAKSLHKNSPRADMPFIALNMADIPKELVESELFGHEKGAFKGAGDQRIGRFEQADKGTLFLDEVGDMPLETQTRLIRVLSSGEFYRIGGNSPIKVDVRIIAATNQNLEEKVRNGSFREDLYHRLNVIKINLPPLRDRKEDILLLTSYFLKKFSEEAKIKVKVLSKEVEELFENLIWPGNVLQLQNVCQSLTLLSSGQEISISDIPKDLSLQRKGPEMSWSDMLESWASKKLLKGDDHILNSATPIFEGTMIKAALKVTKGKKSEAAKLLGWGRNTLARKITELDL